MDSLLALEKSFDRPSTSEVKVKDMGKLISSKLQQTTRGHEPFAYYFQFVKWNPTIVISIWNFTWPQRHALLSKVSLLSYYFIFASIQTDDIDWFHLRTSHKLPCWHGHWRLEFLWWITQQLYMNEIFWESVSMSPTCQTLEVPGGAFQKHLWALKSKSS